MIKKGSLAGVVTLAFFLIQISNVNADEGDLAVIAVSKFDSTFDNPSTFSKYQRSKPQNFEKMIETQLHKVGRFKVFERNRLDQILSEQGLQSALSNNGTKLSIKGVDYLVYGSITNYSASINTINTGSFSSSKLVTTFGLDVRIADASTGEIRRSENVTTTVESGNSIDTGSFNQVNASTSGLVDAQRRTAKKVAAMLTESIFPIRVVDFENGKAYINFGDSILSVGDQLSVIREGKKLVDIDTGRSLGARETVIASLSVVETTGEFSIASLISGDAPAAGDLIRVARTTNNQADSQPKQKFGRKI